MPTAFPMASAHRLPALLFAGLLLAACAEDAPPPASSDAAPAPSDAAELAPLGSVSAGASPDVSAYDVQPKPPAGAVPNTVGTAYEQQDAPPDPLPEQIPSGPVSGGIDYPVTASFVSGHPTIIEVSVRDRQPVDSVELIAPGGAATAAYQLDRNTERVAVADDDGLDMGVAVVGGSSGGVRTGIGIGIPLFGWSDSPPPQDEVVSRARILLPDPTAYRTDWKRYVIRIHLGGTGPSARKMEMAAPQPPA